MSSFPPPAATGPDTHHTTRPPESVVPGASPVAQERRSGLEPDRRLRTSYRAQHIHAHAVRVRRAPHRRGTRNRPPATATGEHFRRPRSLRARSRSDGYHIRCQRPVHQLYREAMRKHCALPVLTLEVESPVSVGGTDRADPVPTCRGLDDLRPEGGDVRLRRPQRVVHHSNPPRPILRLFSDELDVAIRKPDVERGLHIITHDRSITTPQAPSA
jgi:hypothetical protein